jgi:hypothetical protein
VGERKADPRRWHVCEARTYKPGDPRPEGYLEWFEWARVQRRAGLRQGRTRCCSKWLFPQETCKCAPLRAAEEKERGRNG